MAQVHFPDPGMGDKVTDICEHNFNCIYSNRESSTNNWYVSQLSGSNSNDGTTWATAFLTIQKGVNAASDGDNVFIGAGIYDETVLVTTNEISLIGVGNRDDVKICSTAATGYGLYVRAADVTIRNLGVAAPSSASYGTKITGDRFRAIGCQFEMSDNLGNM